MRNFLMSSFITAVCTLAAGSPAASAGPNEVAGAWKPVSVQLDPDGKNLAPYGPEPKGLLVFTEDMRFIELIHDPRIPRFASDVRGEGTAEENRAVMAGSIALYGTYTVDSEGQFSGNTVEGSTFPNWIGDKRSRNELKMIVDGNKMTETFQRPEGAKIVIIWERVR